MNSRYHTIPPANYLKGNPMQIIISKSAAPCVVTRSTRRVSSCARRLAAGLLRGGITMFTALACVAVALLAYEAGRLRGLRIGLELSKPAQQAALDALDAAKELNDLYAESANWTKVQS